MAVDIQKNTILLIENDPIQSEEIKKILENTRLWYEVVVAQNSKEAVSLLDENVNNIKDKICLVLTDLHMWWDWLNGDYWLRVNIERPDFQFPTWVITWSVSENEARGYQKEFWNYFSLISKQMFFKEKDAVAIDRIWRELDLIKNKNYNYDDRDAVEDTLNWLTKLKERLLNIPGINVFVEYFIILAIDFEKKSLVNLLLPLAHKQNI